MKIIGVSAMYQQDNWRYIVELDTTEMSQITQMSQRAAERLHAGSVVDVGKQWTDAMACRAACEAAAQLPATLRATAEVLESVSERVRAIAQASAVAPDSSEAPA